MFLGGKVGVATSRGFVGNAVPPDEKVGSDAVETKVFVISGKPTGKELLFVVYFVFGNYVLSNTEGESLGSFPLLGDCVVDSLRTERDEDGENGDEDCS